MAPTVSVVMPAYNAERYVGAAVSSLLAQGWQDWELVAVDDGSTDATGAILRSFVDPRIHVIQQRNQGEGAARNAAIDAATGRYLAFLDADDLYLPDALEHMVAYLDANPDRDVVLCDGFVCDASARPLMRLSEHRPGRPEGNVLEAVVLSPSVVTVPVCTMMRRDTLRRAGERFDPALTMGVDWDFWIRLARHARFGHLDRPTCMYRLHGQSISRRSSSSERRRSLVRSRLKVMHADWFGALSVRTRTAFLHTFLTTLLAADAGVQRSVLESGAFRSLPCVERVRLLRLVASGHVRAGTELAFGAACLDDALALRPTDLRARALRAALRANPPAARALLRAWSTGRRLGESVRRAMGRTPKPIPSELAFG
jgi:GT2 family glycosyltransferase